MWAVLVGISRQDRGDYRLTIVIDCDPLYLQGLNGIAAMWRSDYLLTIVYMKKKKDSHKFLQTLDFNGRDERIRTSDPHVPNGHGTV